MNHITIKGEKFPVFNTPLTTTDILKIRENHERFIINEVGRSKMVLHRNPIEYNKYRVELGFRSMVNICLCTLGVYYFFAIKKKIKKVTKMNPFPTSQETKEFIDSLGKQAKNGKPEPISL